MEVPVEITIRGVNNREAIEKVIQEKVEKLERVCDQLISCHVAVEQLQKSHKKGNPYHVRVDVHMPGHEIVMKQDSSNIPVEKLVRETFAAARRKVQDIVNQQKSHSAKSLSELNQEAVESEQKEE